MDDTDIIARVRQGDTEAYALLVRKYHRGLLAFIHRLVRDAHLTEDLGQEVFLDAFKSLARFDPERGTPFGAWLYVLARNRCLSQFRKRGRLVLVSVDDAPEPAGDAPGMDEGLIAREERRTLAACLEQLDEPFRTAVRLSLRGQAVEDIARDLGVPASTVKTRLFRAREKLRRLFAAKTGGICHERV